MSTATTHIDNKPSLRGTKQSHPLAPALRFKEFDGEWRETTLGNLFTFKNGLNSDKEKYGSGRKFINVLDIIGNDVITYDSIIGKVEVTEKELEKNEVIYGDVLFQRSSETREEVGQANIYVDENKSAVFGGFVIRGRKKEDYNPYFMNYLLKTSPARKEITTKSGGSTRYNVGQASLSEVIVNLTGVPEQQKIASFLSAVDEKIQQLTKKKALLEQYKKGVMQQLFSGQLRFKPARPAGGDENLSADRHDGNPYPEWKEKKISQVVTEVNERTIENNQFEVLSSTKSGIVLQSEYFNKQVASSDSSNYKIVRKGMFSYRSMSDTGSFTFNIQNVIEIGIVSPAYPVFKVNENQSAFYLYLTLNNSSHFKSQLLAMMEGGTRLALGFSKFKKMIVHLPSFEEQQKIATYLSSIDTKIESVNTQITQTQTFKKGLLQQMFV
jgi:type I restriction enzyme S subunit